MTIHWFRGLAASLILTLTLPPHPAWALRPSIERRGGLERALARAGLEEDDRRTEAPESRIMARREFLGTTGKGLVGFSVAFLGVLVSKMLPSLEKPPATPWADDVALSPRSPGSIEAFEADLAPRLVGPPAQVVFESPIRIYRTSSWPTSISGSGIGTLQWGIRWRRPLPPYDLVVVRVMARCVRVLTITLWGDGYPITSRTIPVSPLVGDETVPAELLIPIPLWTVAGAASAYPYRRLATELTIMGPSPGHDTMQAELLEARAYPTREVVEAWRRRRPLSLPDVAHATWYGLVGLILGLWVQSPRDEAAPFNAGLEEGKKPMPISRRQFMRDVILDMGLRLLTGTGVGAVSAGMTWKILSDASARRMPYVPSSLQSAYQRRSAQHCLKFSAIAGAVGFVFGIFVRDLVRRYSMVVSIEERRTRERAALAPIEKARTLIRGALHLQEKGVVTVWKQALASEGQHGMPVLETAWKPPALIQPVDAALSAAPDTSETEARHLHQLAVAQAVLRVADADKDPLTDAVIEHFLREQMAMVMDPGLMNHGRSPDIQACRIALVLDERLYAIAEYLQGDFPLHPPTLTLLPPLAGLEEIAVAQELLARYFSWSPNGQQVDLLYDLLLIDPGDTRAFDVSPGQLLRATADGQPVPDFVAKAEAMLVAATPRDGGPITPVYLYGNSPESCQALAAWASAQNLSTLGVRFVVRPAEGRPAIPGIVVQLGTVEHPAIRRRADRYPELSLPALFETSSAFVIAVALYPEFFEDRDLANLDVVAVPFAVGGHDYVAFFV